MWSDVLINEGVVNVLSSCFQLRRWASFLIENKTLLLLAFSAVKRFFCATFFFFVCVCAMRARAHRWPLLFLRRPGRGRCEAEQWLRLGEAGGDWLHGRWRPPPGLDPRQHSWPRRRHATPPPGPPLLPRCPGPGGQHLQRATLGIGRAADHPGAQRSGFRVRVGEPRAGLRIGWLFVFVPSFSFLSTFFSLLSFALSLKRVTKKIYIQVIKNKPAKSFYNHGICKQLCTGGLRAGPEKEEPRAPGSDRKVLWRGQETEGQGEDRGRIWVKRPEPSHLCRFILLIHFLLWILLLYAALCRVVLVLLLFLWRTKAWR